MVIIMNYNELDILSILEVLSIVATGVAMLTNLILSLTVLIKSVVAKKNNIILNSEHFSSHDKMFLLSKSCGRYGFIFQFLGWLMFSAQHTGFISLSILTFYFALLWATICIITFIFAIISRYLNGKETNNFMLNKKTTWMMMYSILYFVVTFLIH